MLRLNDIFWTVQGEGFHTGRRALFVRMPYCNYECPWCDTEYNSINFKLTPDEFRKFATQEKARLAVITGGEPAINKQTPLVTAILKDLGFTVAIETNGSVPAPPGVDFITVSPKAYTKGKLEPFYVHPDLLRDSRPKQYKYVYEMDFDTKYLDRHRGELGDLRTWFYLGPEYNVFSHSVDQCLEYIKNNPEWRLNLQTHKWIGVK